MRCTMKERQVLNKAMAEGYPPARKNHKGKFLEESEGTGAPTGGRTRVCRLGGGRSIR